MQNSTLTPAENSSSEVQVAESAQINPGLVATESGVGSRSLSARNLLAPCLCVSSLMLVSFGAYAGIVADRNPMILMPENPSNSSMAYVNQYNQEQQGAINHSLQEAAIYISAFGLGALATQQVWSCMQRSGLIGRRSDLIRESRLPPSAVSGHFVVYSAPNQPSTSLVGGREGENLGSSPAQLQQARPPRYVV